MTLQGRVMETITLGQRARKESVYITILMELLFFSFSITTRSGLIIMRFLIFHLY